MRAKVIIGATAAALVLAVLPSAAAGGGPKPLPQANAEALASAPGHVAAPVVHRVGAREALAAAAQPGAQTEVAPGLTVEQAVGLTAAADGVAPRRLARTAASTICWNGQIHGSWGYWPYNQTVYDSTYWCAVSGGALSYRSTNVTHSATLCSGSGDYTFRISGGVGYTYVAYQVGASFTCPTDLPWITVYRSDWLDDEVNDYGSMFTYASS
ncbi:MAG TPA: hypothetical protein VMU58_11255 [Gaiellaceae bacterium]|nr:hypothetical protein [Gaiellaceae bacterium]